MRKGPNNHQAGFTLMEVVIVVTITAWIIALIGGLLIAILNTQEDLSRQSYSVKVGSGILNVLTRDMEALYSYDIDEPFKIDEEAGDEWTLQLVTAGRSLLPEPSDEEDGFISTSKTGSTRLISAKKLQLKPAPVVLRRVTYELKRASDSGAAAASYILWRSEEPFEGGSEEGDGTGPMYVAQGIRSLSVQAQIPEPPLSNGATGGGGASGGGFSEEEAIEVPKAVIFVLDLVHDSGAEGEQQADPEGPDPYHYETTVFIAVDSVPPEQGGATGQSLDAGLPLQPPK